MSLRILVIEHEAGTDARRFGDWLERAGAELIVARPYLGSEHAAPGSEHADPGPSLPADAAALRAAYDALIVLGGAAGPLDDEDNPWFPHVRSLLAASAEGAFPSFNICLGGELLAAATGGQLRRRRVPQVGAYIVAARPEAADDPVFSAMPASAPVVLWHQEEMGLPPGAVHLVDGTDAPVQAFRIGQAWGTQFHPETTAEQARGWGADVSMPVWCGRAREQVLAEIANAEPEVEAAMAPLAAAFADYLRR